VVDGSIDVADPVNPAVGNIEGQDNAAGPKHTAYFRERVVLERHGFQMMHHKDGDRG
jgi:hypothetical protein